MNTNIAQLISDLRASVSKDSISPENLAVILEALLGAGDEQLRSTLNRDFATDVTFAAQPGDVELGVDVVNPVTGTTGEKCTAMPMAGPTQAGFMSTAQAAQLELLAAAPSLRYLYTAAGAVYDANTRRYSLNGLTDITETEMAVIYNQPFRPSMTQSCIHFKGRTNIPSLDSGGMKTADLYAAFYGALSVEKIRLTTNSIFYTNNLFYAFHSCRVLVSVEPVIKFSSTSLSTLSHQNVFSQCFALQEVRLQNMQQDISFADCPLITLDSLLYIVEHAKVGSSFCITLHADAFARLTDELIEAGAVKNISFIEA